MSSNLSGISQGGEVHGETDPVRNRSERLWRTGVALVYYIANLVLNAFIISVVHERVPFNALPLPDIAFDLLPFWQPAIYYVECFIFGLNLSLLAMVLCHRSGHRIAQRYFIITGIVYFFRAFSLSMTQLPNPGVRVNCLPKMLNNVTTFEFVSTVVCRVPSVITSLGTQMLSDKMYCGDYLFSGHTINIVQGYLFLSTYLFPSESYNNWLWLLFKNLLFILSSFAVVLILVSRGHYLVDVVYGYYISTRIFYIYHSLCYHVAFHYPSPSNFFTRFWWWTLFAYFEVDAEPIVIVDRFRNPFRLLRQ